MEQAPGSESTCLLGIEAAAPTETRGLDPASCQDRESLRGTPGRESVYLPWWKGVRETGGDTSFCQQQGKDAAVFL